MLGVWDPSAVPTPSQGELSRTKTHIPHISKSSLPGAELTESKNAHFLVSSKNVNALFCRKTSCCGLNLILNQAHLILLLCGPSVHSLSPS